MQSVIYSSGGSNRLSSGMMHRLSKDQFSVQSTGRQTPWAEKIEKGFFRGRDSRQERLDLAEMSQKNPELIDAAITRYFFFKEDESKHGPRSEHVPFADHFKFKYQSNHKLFRVRFERIKICDQPVSHTSII